METDTELMYVDTCFLMQAKGREYIAAGKGRCRVIVSVKRELLRLSARNLAAREACLFCEKEPAPVEFVPLLPEERECRASMQTLRNLSRDTDPTIRSRALELIQFATAKNAPAVK